MLAKFRQLRHVTYQAHRSTLVNLQEELFISGVVTQSNPVIVVKHTLHMIFRASLIPVSC